jgi:hypothetical protein
VSSKQKALRILKTGALYFLLPGAALFLGIGWATGSYRLSSLIAGLAGAAGMYLLSIPDRRFIAPRLKGLGPEWLRFGLETTASLLEHLLGVAVPVFICSRIFAFRIEPSLAWAVLGGILIGFPIIHGTSAAIHHFRQLKEKERLQERLLNLATQAELRALKAQIDPHFLFNTLNTIAQLIHSNAEKAEALIERLAAMYHYVLSSSKRGLIPLEEELAFVQDYLEVEKARFGDKLRISTTIDGPGLAARVPGLILQPLVENAVRHGRTADGRIDLGINLRDTATDTVVEVSDRGPGLSPGFRIEECNGTGLRNINERLKRCFGEQYCLEHRSNRPSGCIFVMRIPREISCENNSSADR